MYDIDFSKVVQWLLPSVIRKPRMVAWLGALLYPIALLHNRFAQFRVAVSRDIAVTPQVRVLGWWLNEVFNGGHIAPLIYITDASALDVVYMFTEDENRPLYLPKFISGTVGDFIVRVPIGLKNQDLAIRAFVNKYKLPGKRYTIIYY